MTPENSSRTILNQVILFAHQDKNLPLTAVKDDGSSWLSHLNSQGPTWMRGKLYPTQTAHEQFSFDLTRFTRPSWR